MTMPSTTPYSFGGVVLVGFPFTSLQTTKKRPAVVISSAAYQQNRPDVILMAITSQTDLISTPANIVSKTGKPPASPSRP